MPTTIIPFARRAGIEPRHMTAVPVRARVWARLGEFDHHLPDRYSAVRLASPEFAEWMEFTLQGDIYYDAQYLDRGEGFSRARWVMLFSNDDDAVAFSLRWL